MTLSYTDYSKYPIIAVDIETVDPFLKDKGPGVYRRDGYILGISFSNGDRSEYYPFENTADAIKNKRYAKEQLASHNKKIFANGLYDLDWLENFQDFKVNGEFEDIQVAEPLINEYLRSYSLDSLAEKYLKERKEVDILREYAIKQGWKLGSKGTISHLFKDMPIDLMAQYASKDTELTYKIFSLQEEILKRDSLWDVYRMEMDLYPLLLQMRKTGVRMDEHKIPKLGLALSDLKHDIQEELNEVYGGELNVNSAPQLKYLWEKLGIPIVYGEPTDLMLSKGLTRGNPKFDKRVLERLTHPVAKKVLELRHILTIISLFLHPYPEFITNGRIHCSFHSLRSDEYGTVSGRFSSSNPNLQQVSGKEEEEHLNTDDEFLKGLIVRKLFLPEENCDWMKNDWSQIEYRLIAHYAMGDGAEYIRKRYNEDPKTDYHNEMGQMTGIENRKIVKTFNFGASYGMGVDKMANMYGWDLNEAKLMYDLYHKKVPFVRETSKRVALKAKKFGYIRTLLGRRAHLPSSNKGYVMFNRLIQGSAADLMKKAMLDAYKKGVFQVLHPHLTVHDELDVSRPRTKEGREAGRELIHTMENCIQLRIPVKVDTGIGPNWGELKEEGSD